MYEVCVRCRTYNVRCVWRCSFEHPGATLRRGYVRSILCVLSHWLFEQRNRTSHVVHCTQPSYLVHLNRSSRINMRNRQHKPTSIRKKFLVWKSGFQKTLTERTQWIFQRSFVIPTIMNLDKFRSTYHCKEILKPLTPQVITHRFFLQTRQKNTIYALAKEKFTSSIERFALDLAQHFMLGNPQLSQANVEIEEHLYSRLSVDGKQHPHAYISNGNEKHTALIEQSRDRIIVT